MGFGTTPEGKDYWIIRNSWSRLWGVDGYALIARGRRDCGITTSATRAVVAANAKRAAVRTPAPKKAGRRRRRL